MTQAIRVELPAALSLLARCPRDLCLAVPPPATLAALLDAIEAAHPSLRGTLRDQTTRQRRAYIRFYAGEEDLSHRPTDEPLPSPVVNGSEPLLIVGAIAGG